MKIYKDASDPAVVYLDNLFVQNIFGVRRK
jgi:hypothetical protein